MADEWGKLGLGHPDAEYSPEQKEKIIKTRIGQVTRDRKSSGIPIDEYPNTELRRLREHLKTVRNGDNMAEKEWLTPKRAVKQEATAMLKADEKERIEAKRPPIDNVAEEKEMRRARESVRPRSGGGGGGGGIGTPSQLGGAKREFNPFKMKQGGKVSASSRGDGIAQRGKTKGRMV